MKLNKIIFLITFLALATAGMVYAWGFFGHKRINKMAVFTLPEDLMGFYKANIDFVEEHAVDPDKRRYAVKEEAPRHYIDLDHYGDHPLDSVPKFWNDAVAKYSEDTLNTYGIVPWHISLMLNRLTKAFREKNYEQILHYSADIGHYIGDAHVPLHCTENYNGQLTNQVGIHGFWESRIPEMYADEYDYFIGKAKFIDKPIDYIWKIIRESYMAKDSVLRMEAALNAVYNNDQKYAFEQRGNTMMRVYSQDYTRAYNDSLNGMVERRMRSAIIAVGSFWFTAWTNAGMPDLTGIEKITVSDEMNKQQDDEDKMWRTGKVINGKGHDD
jgi:S1/P1 Nuclease